VVGLPETGKSSFIQALDEVLRNPRSDKDLRSYGLADDRSYLEREKDRYHAGEELERNNRLTENTSVELWFEDPTSGRRCRLQLPDRKGEVFKDQWVDRRWSREYRDELLGLSGALVFVRADEKSQNQELLGQLIESAGQDNEPRTTRWDARKASAQVQLVDVLQFIGEAGILDERFRVAVMISAWDTVLADKTGFRSRDPEVLLQQEWALLSQYLRSNEDVFEHRVYGVSAYGGTPGKLGKTAELPPHERVQLVDGSGVLPDFTCPLKWILSSPCDEV
jgi:hypothetical protein